MSLRTFASPLTHWVIRGSELLRTFGQWWLKEFLAPFPERVSDWLIERGSRILVLAVEEGTVALQLMSDRRRLLASAQVSRNEYSPELIDAFLQSHRHTRKLVSIGVSLPPSSIFGRSLVLPLETKRSLDAIVVQDLVAKTPFQLDDIYHAHTARRVADKIAIYQWVVRRGHVNEVVEALGLDLNDIAFVESQGAKVDDEPLPVMTLRRPPADRNRWVQRASLAFAMTAFLLAVTAGGLTYQRQQLILDSLGAEVTTAKAKAKHVLAAIDKLEQEQARLLHLRSRKSGEPGLLDVWEEITRVLPSHTWLTELRISETLESRQVVMSGFSVAAAQLVGFVDRSALFSDASLIAPISMDQTEERERFAIQANVKSHGKPMTASR